MTEGFIPVISAGHELHSGYSHKPESLLLSLPKGLNKTHKADSKKLKHKKHQIVVLKLLHHVLVDCSQPTLTAQFCPRTSPKYCFVGFKNFK